MNIMGSQFLPRHPPSQSQQVRRSLCLLAIAIGLHTVVDPAITYLVVIYLEVGFETTPFIQTRLHAGLFPFILMHIPVYVLSIGAALTFRWLLQQASGREQIAVYYLSIIGFSGLICWGLAIVLNNIWVLWAGL